MRLPTSLESSHRLLTTVKLVAGLTWRGKQRGWPPLATHALTLAALICGIGTVMSLFYMVPFPNILLDPSFRWPDDGLDEFARRVLKFQMVLAGYSLAAGVWYVR